MTKLSESEKREWRFKQMTGMKWTMRKYRPNSIDLPDPIIIHRIKGFPNVWYSTKERFEFFKEIYGKDNVVKFAEEEIKEIKEDKLSKRMSNDANKFIQEMEKMLEKG